MLLRPVLAAASALSLLFLACSSTEATSPDGGSVGFLPDSAAPKSDVGTPVTACKPADVSNFTADAYHAARAEPNTCTLDQIGRFYTACLAAGSSTCDVFTGTDAGEPDQLCAACILSRTTDPTYGPVIEHGGWQELNVAGCLELTDGNLLSCAKSYQAAEECEDQACKDNCPVTDSTSYGAYQACTNQAAAIGCENFAGPAACATTNVPDASAVCASGATFQESFTAFALLFCGSRDGGVAPATDAAASSDSDTDALEDAPGSD